MSLFFCYLLCDQFVAPERLRLRTPWHKEAPNVQQVADGSQWPCQTSAVLQSFSLSQAWRSMVAITGTCCWNSRCCQSCVVLLVTRTCSSRIALQLTVLATLSSYCSRRLQSSLHSTCGRQTAGLEPGWLPCLGSHAGTSLQNWSAWHSWPQATPHWDLVEYSTDCHWWSHWWVGLRLRACVQAQGRHFEHSL